MVDEELEKLDLWRKLDICSENGQFKKSEQLGFHRLKIVMLEDTMSRDKDLCDSVRDLYRDTYLKYRRKHDEFIPSSPLIQNLHFNNGENIKTELLEEVNSYPFLYETHEDCLDYKREEKGKPREISVKRSYSPYNNSSDESKESEPPSKNPSTSEFMTAKQILVKNGGQINAQTNDVPKNNAPPSYSSRSCGRVLGVGQSANRRKPGLSTYDSAQNSVSNNASENDNLPQIKGVEKRLVELIMNDIIEKRSEITWDDIAGLDHAKKTVEEIVVWPMKRPDLFKGLLGPVKGILLFGPPGTGKTLIGKCIAHQCNATFFSISASSLTSRYVGEGEKLVRTLFAVARHFQPSVVFLDEVDSLLTSRSESEHESTRRIKTEFLVQLDGCASISDDKILIVGATNRPQELDDAARRRFVKRLYVPLPHTMARTKIMRNLLSKQKFSLTDTEIEDIVCRTDGYSGADMMNLCKEAALSPIRDISDISSVSLQDIRPISYEDFLKALKQVKSSVSPKDIQLYTDWNNLYGMTISE